MHRTDGPQLTLIPGGGRGGTTAGGPPGRFPRSIAPPTKRIRRDKADIPPSEPEPAEHEGGTDDQVGDRTGPAVGYDTDPEQVKDKGGVV